MAVNVISSPRRVTIAVTGRCNLRCGYCFYADEMVALDDLSTEQWLSFFAELGSLGVMQTTLTGGEVFTRRDIFELIDGLIANRMRYTLLSNGTLITDETLKQFEVGKRRQRLSHIQISIDGSTQDVHNLSRPKSFSRAIRGLRLLKEAEFPVGVRVTINRHNLHDLENIARLLLEEIGLHTFSTNDAIPIGAGCDNQGQIALNVAERAEAMRILRALEGRYPGRIRAQAGPLALSYMYEDMEEARRTGASTSPYTTGTLSACGCIFDRLDILHDGSIVPCNMLPELVLGNVTTHSLQDLWLNHQTLDQMRTRRTIPLSAVPGCADCGWNQHCNGSCPALAYREIGDINRANPRDCYQRFLNEKDQDEGKDYRGSNVVFIT